MSQTQQTQQVVFDHGQKGDFTESSSKLPEKVAIIFSRIPPNIWRANRDNNSAVTVAMSPPVLSRC